MKCHTCKKEVVSVGGIDEDGEDVSDWWECPGGCAILQIDASNNKICSYTLFIDQDDVRYKIRGYANTTTLWSKKVPAITTSKRRHQSKYYNQEWSIPMFIVPNIKDDVLQSEQLIDKIEKLMAFS